jgi:hypothetical protein
MNDNDASATGKPAHRPTVEQGQDHWPEAPTSSGARLVHPNPPLTGKAHSRSCKLRGCNVVAVRVDDVAPSGYTSDRATVRQKKTGRPVRFEMTEQTRQAIDEYLRVAGRRLGQFLFAGRRGPDRGLTTRQLLPAAAPLRAASELHSVPPPDAPRANRDTPYVRYDDARAYGYARPTFGQPTRLLGVPR